MERLKHKSYNLARRKARIRAKITGTPDRPRLAVKISNLHVSAQLIDDTTGTTLLYSSSVSLKSQGSLTNKAEDVGLDIAKKAKAKGIKKIALDRAGKQYHGRLKALADKARSEGLEF